MKMNVGEHCGSVFLLMLLCASCVPWLGCAADSEPPQLPIPVVDGETAEQVTEAESDAEMTEIEDPFADTESDEQPLEDVIQSADVDVEASEEFPDVVSDVGDVGDVLIADGGDVISDGDIMADVNWGPEPACLFPYGETITVRLKADGNPVRAMNVNHPGVASISYVYDGVNRLFAVDEAGEVWWESEVGSTKIFGGFDFDGDDWPDVGLISAVDTSEACGSNSLKESLIKFVSGMTGEILEPLTAAQKDRCLEIPPEFAGGEPTFEVVQQWTDKSILFGELPGLIALTPTLAVTGLFVQYDEGWTQTSFVFPSTAQFETEYVGAEFTLWNETMKYVENSHQANGLVIDSSTGPRLVLFTSGRVLQYNYGTYGVQQLLTDHPFISGNRLDLEGRNEGLVAVDPSSPNLVVLLAGTDANSLFRDRITGQQQEDPWGGTERHLTIYDVEKDILEDRFFSNAKDGGGSFQYEGRLAYPMNPFVAPLEPGTPSRLAYNVFEDGQWHLHISQPGSTEDLTVLPGLYLWNIQDLDGNGIAEWVISPTHDPDAEGVSPDDYFPDWETQFYQWSEESLELKLANIIGGANPQKVIPYILKSDNESYRTAGTTSFNGHLNSLLIREEDCNLFFGVRNAESSAIEWVEL